MKTVNVMLVENDDDLRSALRRIEELWQAEAGSPEANELEALTIMVEAYESRFHPVPPPSPVAAIRFVMDQRGLRNRDLEPFIGAASRVSEVLSGKANLTVAMIRRLHDGLGIPYESLIGGEAERKSA